MGLCLSTADVNEKTKIIDRELRADKNKRKGEIKILLLSKCLKKKKLNNTFNNKENNLILFQKFLIYVIKILFNIIITQIKKIFLKIKIFNKFFYLKIINIY